jgi:hypothetical protein
VYWATGRAHCANPSTRPDLLWSWVGPRGGDKGHVQGTSVVGGAVWQRGRRRLLVMEEGNECHRFEDSRVVGGLMGGCGVRGGTRWSETTQ